MLCSGASDKIQAQQAAIPILKSCAHACQAALCYMHMCTGSRPASLHAAETSVCFYIPRNAQRKPLQQRHCLFLQICRERPLLGRSTCHVNVITEEVIGASSKALSGCLTPTFEAAVTHLCIDSVLGCYSQWPAELENDCQGSWEFPFVCWMQVAITELLVVMGPIAMLWVPFVESGSVQVNPPTFSCSDMWGFALYVRLLCLFSKYAAHLLVYLHHSQAVCISGTCAKMTCALSLQLC